MLVFMYSFKKYKRNGARLVFAWVRDNVTAVSLPASANFWLTYKQVGDISIAKGEIIYTSENQTDATFNKYSHQQIK